MGRHEHPRNHLVGHRIRQKVADVAAAKNGLVEATAVGSGPGVPPEIRRRTVDQSLDSKHFAVRALETGESSSAPAQ